SHPLDAEVIAGIGAIQKPLRTDGSLLREKAAALRGPGRFQEAFRCAQTRRFQGSDLVFASSGDLVDRMGHGTLPNLPDRSLRAASDELAKTGYYADDLADRLLSRFFACVSYRFARNSLHLRHAQACGHHAGARGHDAASEHGAGSGL